MRAPREVRHVFDVCLAAHQCLQSHTAHMTTPPTRHVPARGSDPLRNCGEHTAAPSGVRAARSDVVVTLDDDLQHPPEEIPALLAALDGDAELHVVAPT